MKNIPELKGGQMITIAYIIGILVVLYIVYNILQKIGIIKSAEKKELESKKIIANEQIRSNDIFSPYYLKDKVYKSLGQNAAVYYATELRDAMKLPGTNEEKIYSTFGKIYNKVNVSEISLAYTVKFDRDLQTDLLNELKDKELVTLWDIINKLPNN